jgi:hypothetical protein
MRETGDCEIEREVERQIEIDEILELEGERRLVPGAELSQPVQRKPQRFNLWFIECEARMTGTVWSPSAFAASNTA